jgi:dolichol-phosphate mannosyltransferase
MEKTSYSIVVPVFNEEDNLENLFKRLTGVMETIANDYEIIFVDDNSRDGSLGILESLNRGDPRVKIIKLSRNFGHQAALTAGLDHAKGDAIITMDADLQDPPEAIPCLINKYEEGYDIVYAKREERKGETAFKRWTASMFYRIMRRLTDVEIPLDTGDFRLINKKVLNSLKGLQEKNRFLRGLVSWVGFKQAGVMYQRDARSAGKTKFTFTKMLKFAVDAISSFSHIPLRVATLSGFAVSFISCLGLILVVWHRFAGRPASGWASLMICVLFIGGVQLISIGIIGEYLGRIYDEVKNRPLYICDKTIGLRSKDEKPAS